MTKKIDSKILLIILLFIVSGMVIFFTFSTIKQTYEIKDIITGEQLLSAQYSRELAELNSIKAQEEDISGILLQFGYKIPAEPGEDEIIEYISDVTGEAELLGITFNDRVPNDIAVEMPIKISIKSDYFTMLTILRNIVGASRLYTVSDIDITSADGLAVNYTINLSAYYA